MDHDSPGDSGAPGFAEALLGALPGAVLVVDGFATVQFATNAVAELVGIDHGTMVGRSVLEFVSEDTAWAYAAAVALATDYADVVMGPLRVSLVRSDGCSVDADLWAANHLEDPLIGGIVCLVTDQTTSSGLTEAVAALVDGSGTLEVARRVSAAMAGHPTVADADVVWIDAQRDDGSDDEVTDALVGLAGRALETGTRQLFADRDQMGAADPRLVAHATANGYEALWVEPVPATARTAPEAALVLWRRRPGNPSPNQLRSVFQGAAIAGLALRSSGDPAPAVER